jgi:peptidoglycan biosynthesis protein MviN/MurJ (putative lipid II flippase)
LLLGLGILATLAREVLLGATFGTQRELELFRVAFGLPNMMGQTLAPAFVGVTLPWLAAAARRGPDELLQTRRMIDRFGLGFALAVTAVLVAGAPWLTAWMAPGFSEDEVTRAAAQLRWLALLFLGLAASFPLRARLNRRGVFWPGASNSLLLSLAIVLSCGFGLTDDAGTQALVAASVAGAATVWVLHRLAATRLDRTPEPEPNAADAEEAEPSAQAPEVLGSRPTRRMLLLGVLGASLYQLTQAVPRFLDRGFASGHPGELAALEYSFNVLTAPGILFGTSLVMLAFPSFARYAADGHAREGFRRLGKWFALAVGAAALVGLLCLKRTSRPRRPSCAGRRSGCPPWSRGWAWRRPCSACIACGCCCWSARCGSRCASAGWPGWSPPTAPRAWEAPIC